MGRKTQGAKGCESASGISTTANGVSRTANGGATAKAMKGPAHTGSLRPRKTDRRTLYTRQVIREAYFELLVDHEPQAITVVELCRRAEINRSTFYLHYTDSLSVLEELMTEVIDRMASYAQKMYAKDGVDWSVGRHGYEEIMADERLAFLLGRCMQYPPFISRLADVMAEAALPAYQSKSTLPSDDLLTLLAGLNYSLLTLDARWLRHCTIEELEHKNELFNRYIMAPAHDRITSRD